MKDKLSPNLRGALSTSVWGDLCWHCHILCYCWHHSHPSSPGPASHHTMRPPLQPTKIRPRYTHSHLSITKDEEGIMASRVCHFYRHLTSPQSHTLWVTKRHKESSDFFLLHIQWTIQLLYKDNMSIVFCEMLRTMGVSGAMAVMAVSSVQSTCYNEPILRVRGSQISMGPCHARMLSHITGHTKTWSYNTVRTHDHTTQSGHFF